MTSAVASGSNAVQAWRESERQVSLLKAQVLEEQGRVAGAQIELANRTEQLAASERRIGSLRERLTSLVIEYQEVARQRKALKAQLQSAKGTEAEQAAQNEVLIHRNEDLQRELAARNDRITGLERAFVVVLQLQYREKMIRDLVIEILDLKLKISEAEIEQAHAIWASIGLQALVSPVWAAASAVTFIGVKVINGNLDNSQQSVWRKQILQRQSMLERIKNAPLG